jgi:hypothetical protein
MRPCECESCVAARAARAARDAQRFDGETKSKILLRAWLSARQLVQYERDSFFEVVGSQSGKRYRIVQGFQQNVFELDTKGRPFRGWCFVPRGLLPAGDVMLAQKIALETDEEAVMKVAAPFWTEPELVRLLRWAAAIWQGPII